MPFLSRALSHCIRNEDALGRPIPHWHVLEGHDAGTVGRTLEDGTVSFPNLIVTRTTATHVAGGNEERAREIRNTEDQHVIRLCFSMLFRDERGRVLQVGDFATDSLVHTLIHFTRMPTRTHTRVRAPAHARTHTHTHAHTHIITHTHTHTHTHTQRTHTYIHSPTFCSTVPLL
jgi:hypothetical protein